MPLLHATPLCAVSAVAPALRRAAVAALLVVAGTAQAQPAASESGCPPAARAPTAVEAAAHRRDAVDRGFLWQLHRDGRSSVLYGTLQAAKAGWMQPGPRVMQALADSDVLALEVDPLDPEMQRRTAAAVAPHPQQQLPGLLALRLRSQQRQACVSAPDGQAVAPEVQAAQLLLLAGRRDGFDPAYGIDGALAALARALGKPVVSLATPESQLAVVIGIPRRGRAMIDSLLAQIEDGTARSTIRRLGTAWAEGRLDELARYGDWCACMKTDDDRTLARLLIDERNPGLAARIEALHADGRRVFATVGGLHTVGPAGLPALLEARGFRVERVEFAPR